MNDFASTLPSGQESSMYCDAYAAQLAEYAYAQIPGNSTTDDFTQIENHIRLCPHCMDEVNALIEIAQATYAEDIPTDVPLPKLDLSFLENVPKLSPFTDMFGNLAVDLSSISTHWWRETESADLPFDLRIQTDESLIQIMFTDDLCRLSIQKGEHYLTLSIHKKDAMDAPQYCILIFNLDIKVQKYRLNSEGIKITIKNDEEALHEQYTDAFGQVRFENVEKSTLNHFIIELSSDMSHHNFPIA